MWAFGFRSTDDISQIIDKWIFISSNGCSRRKCQSFCHIWDMVDKMRVFLFPIRARNCLFSNRSIRSPSPGLPGSACHPASPYSCPCRRTVGPACSAGCLVRPGPGPEFRVGFVCGFLRRNKNASGPIRRHKQIQDPYTQKDPPPMATSPSDYFSDRMDQFETICN